MKRALVVMIAMIILPASYAQMHGGDHGTMMMDNNGQQDSSMMCKTMMGSDKMDPGMMDHDMMSGMMGSGMMNPMASLMDLGLSDGQLEQLIEIQAELVRASIPHQRNILATRQKLDQLNLASQPDMKGVEEQKSVIAKSEAELAKVTSASREKALMVLNDEQLVALGETQLPMPMHSNMSCPMMSGGNMNMMGGEEMESGMKMGSAGTQSGTTGGDHESHH